MLGTSRLTRPAHRRAAARTAAAVKPV